MKDPKYLLCADIDRERIDVGIYGEGLECVASSSRQLNNGTEEGEPVLEKQDPNAWLDGLIACTDTLHKEHPDLFVHVTAISMTGPSCVFILLDNGEHPNLYSLLHPGSGADIEKNPFDRESNIEHLFETTANEFDQCSARARLLWLRNNKNRLYTAISKLFFNPKDYIGFLLSGNHSTDFTTASATGLLNVHHKDWEERLLRSLHIKRDVLPRVARGEERAGRIQKKWAARLHLPEDTLVLNGLGHAAALALAAGINREDRCLLYSDRLGFVLVPCADPCGKSAYNLLNYNAASYLAISPPFGSGSSIEWALKTFYSEKHRPSSYIEEPVSEIIASEIEKKPSPVLFLPYPLRETHRPCTARTRGAIFGLTLHTKNIQIVQGVLEGVSFCFNHWFNLVNGNNRKTVFLSGETPLSDIFCTVLASMMNKRIVRLKKEMASRCYGAAAIGLKHLKPGSQVPVSLPEREMGTIFSPNDSLHRAYKLHLSRFESLYSELKEHLIRLSNLESAAGRAGSFGA